MTRLALNRLLSIILLLSSCSLGIYIILSNLRDNIVFFHTPSEIDKIKINQKIRVGGVVKYNSIYKLSANKIKFTITDHKQDLQIVYTGILPALFREGQGIIAEGSLDNNIIFTAKKLLTKHDENYRPPK